MVHRGPSRTRRALPSSGYTRPKALVAVWTRGLAFHTRAAKGALSPLRYAVRWRRRRAPALGPFPRCESRDAPRTSERWRRRRALRTSALRLLSGRRPVGLSTNSSLKSPRERIPLKLRALRGRAQDHGHPGGLMPRAGLEPARGLPPKGF